MLDISASLQSKLDQSVTTFCHCWRVQRHDGAVLGFTDHDMDILFNGVRFLSGGGFEASQVETAIGLSAASGEVIGAFSHASITEADLRNGLYDGASVEVWLVDWMAVDDRVLLDVSIIGEVRHTDSTFNAELRSQASLFDQQRGGAYQKVCAAELGDSRCKVDLLSAAYRRVATVDSFTGGVIIATFQPPVEEGFFTGGALLFSGGENQGARFTVKSHLNFDTRAHISLWTAPAGAVSPGTPIILIAGCDKRSTTCHKRFLNIVNFRGFPLMPRNDTLLTFPGTRDKAMDGGSLFR
jgi:uncharacterized phage protein (TIGR02218 family)